MAAIPETSDRSTVTDKKDNTKITIPQGSGIKTSHINRFNPGGRETTSFFYGGGGGGQSNLDLDKEMLKNIDYTKGEGNEIYDDSGEFIGYGASYGDKSQIDVTPSYNFFEKYDDNQKIAEAKTQIQLETEEKHWADEGATSEPAGTYLNPLNPDGTGGTGINLGSTDAEKAADKAAADKAAADKAAADAAVIIESEIEENLIPAPDFYRGMNTTEKLEKGGFVADFYRINEAGEYVDNTGKNRKEGWVPEAGDAPNAPQGEHFYFGAYGELPSGSKNNKDKPWYSPPAPGYTTSPQKGIIPTHKDTSGSTYFMDPKGSGMYVQNIDNKQSKEQIQKQLNKQKADRAYNQMTKEWTFDYLRATGDKKKTKKQAYSFLDSKIKIMDAWGMGQGGAGFGGTRESNKKDLKKRIKQAYGQRNTETQNFYGMLNRQQPQNNKKGPGNLFGNPITWDQLSDPNYSY